ncbi:MAG: MBL fold metallo-hydrolase, partial [Gammaproteobacteria bacterium]
MNNKCAAILGLLFVTAAGPSWSACREDGLQLQVLGSGGPGHAAGRASTAYVLWQNGASRFMVDAGSGSKDQFHQAGVNLAQIELLALSHLHPDHSAELPAILWPAGASFAIAGPSSGNQFPSIGDFIAGQFGPQGVYPILGDRVNLDVIEVDAAGDQVSEVWQQGEARVRGRRVPHGNVPAIGYRFDFADASIAFTSDQNGSDPGFIDFIDGVDFLVIHLAANED